jgi:hypothetical protein
MQRAYTNLLARHSIRVNTPIINNEFTRQWLAQISAEADAPQDMSNALPVQLL